MRVRIADGHWPAVHASCPTGAATPPGSVAVTIQAADAAGVAPLVFHAPGSPLAGASSPGSQGRARQAGLHRKRELVAGILGRRL